MRGFLSGVIWGGVVATLGLGVLSQLAPAPQSAVRSANVDAPPVVTAEPAPMPEAAPETAAPPVEAEAAAPEAVAPPPAPTVAPEAAVPPVAAVTPPALGVVPSPAAPPAMMPAETAAAPATSEPGRPEAGADADDAPPLVEPPPVPPLTAEEQALLEQPLPAEIPADSPLAPDTAVEAPAAEPAPPPPEAPAEPLLDRPEPGLGGAVEGVTTGRLPVIDAAPEALPEVSAPEASAVPDLVLEDDPRPLVRFAASFDNPQNKPLYTIVLIDTGSPDLDRTALANLPLPVTIALDPTVAGVAAQAAAYRAAGKEVAMLAAAIPKGATPADLQVTFEAHAKALPEAVAVVDLPQGGFQNDRPLASDLVPVIKDQGRGLVTFDRGLNAGDQVARREAVPSALIFRQIDAEGESIPVMRRYLDRAAFKAAQDGQVAVLGTATPDTLAALLEWAAEGRAGSVALAPLSAILSAP